MFVSNLKNRMKRLRRLAAVRRLWRREDGAAAVEFSLVMLPFLTLFGVIIQTALVFFAGQTLETAAADAGRLVMTGQAQTFDQTAFKNAVCQRIYGLFDCTNGMYVDVRTFGSFGSITNGVTFDASGKPVTTFQPGSAGDIVVVRLIYQWPILAPLAQNFLADANSSSRLLVATAVFRNEPYNP